MTLRPVPMLTLALGMFIRDALAAPTVALVPSHATTDHSIVGGTILVHEVPSRVYLDVLVSGWDADGVGRQLRVVQVGVARASFSSGAIGALETPLVSCAGADDCASIGTGSQCVTRHPPGEMLCEAGFQDLTRSDWVYACCTAIAAASQVYENQSVAFGATPLSQLGVADDGTPKYVGTLTLDVPVYAAGAFTIQLDRNDNTFLADQATRDIRIDNYLDAIVQVDATVACCLQGGACEDIAADECNQKGGVAVGGAACDVDATEGGACPSDCDANGIYDAVDPTAFDCNENRIPDACEGLPPANELIARVPAAGAPLTRIISPAVLLEFACEATVPPVGEIGVRRLLPNGKYGANVARQFAITRIVDSEGRYTRLLLLANATAAPFVDKAWYSVRSTNGWDDVEPFEAQFPVLVGDVDGNLFRTNADVLRINAAIPSNVDVLTDRRDVDGNGVINNADVLLVNALGMARMPPKPSGH